MAQLAYSRSQDAARWDEYVWAHPRSTAYHRMGWRRIIEDTFGHQTFYLMALENHRIVGILPLVLIKSPIFGKFLAAKKQAGENVRKWPTIETNRFAKP